MMSDFVVIGQPLLTTAPEEHYYVEPTGVRESIQHTTDKVQQVVIGSLRSMVQQIVKELEDCTDGKEWEAELTVDIGIGPNPAHLAGKLAVKIKGK